MRAILAALLLALAATAAIAAPKDRGPQWASLNADQQQSRAPRPGEWDKLSKPHKTKWLGIAKRYPEMKPEEQKRVQDRMQKWTKLTPEQRWQAREQYRSIGKMAPDRRREELRRYWAEYQALPPHEKRMFDVPPSYMPPAERRQRPAPAKPRPHQNFVLPPHL
jgi:Spy/CpxP family protein refolding chaperone